MKSKTIEAEDEEASAGTTHVLSQLTVLYMLPSSAGTLGTMESEKHIWKENVLSLSI